ncbi:hypothetical protein HOLleu_07266 [Holothuria leucospilota]|uniref:Uncharacterized protein n=1 Tax=Holothuria leucospilota TaxID=206669 RepID=A0A9Q1CFP7_HOLLE|nr:hypothetical protein HOLleu_07266 [Holothuria leucospilota]
MLPISSLHTVSVFFPKMTGSGAALSSCVRPSLSLPSWSRCAMSSTSLVSEGVRQEGSSMSKEDAPSALPCSDDKLQSAD